MIVQYLRNVIPETHPLRLLYHKLRAVAANIIYGFPSNKLIVVGVTGTKGKTTTTNLITHLLVEAGFKVGMTSTIGFRVGSETWNNPKKVTTLDPFTLQKMLRQMVNEGCTHAVLEVSSHSLVQNRVWGINFDMAVLTNMGEDHLDYHGGFQEYLRAKGLLFEHLNKSLRKPGVQKVSILNVEDENFAYFDQFLADRKFTFGLKSGTCHASQMKMLQDGSSFTLHVPNHSAEVKVKLPGEFNVMNCIAAASVALANGISVEVIKSALEEMKALPGRFEQIDCGQPFTVVVDYAHTTESLAKILQLYKEQTPGKLWAVFGATGGGRDVGKRKKMGEAADKIANEIILTDDDPYEEDRMTIIEHIAQGINRQEGHGLWKIVHRHEALRFALGQAQKGDTVVITGKGAEQIQMVGQKAIPWDDRKIVREILSKAIAVEL